MWDRDSFSSPPERQTTMLSGSLRPFCIRMSAPALSLDPCDDAIERTVSPDDVEKFDLEYLSFPECESMG